MFLTLGKKIVMGDKNMKNAETIAEIMNNAGFDVEPVEMDLSSRESIKKHITQSEKEAGKGYLQTPAATTRDNRCGSGEWDRPYKGYIVLRKYG